jgi:hypothetical protein
MAVRSQGAAEAKERSNVIGGMGRKVEEDGRGHAETA